MKFVNPYNFIPIPSKKQQKYEESDCHTGVIEYTITTKSPIFIPNTSCNQAFPEFKSDKKDKPHYSYDFYSYDELESGVDYTSDPRMPVIPGSEIRGMIRNVYETLTDSCMRVLNDDEVPVKRSAEAFCGGVIRKMGNEYYLYGAHDVRYRHFEEEKRKGTKEGSKVFFKKIEAEGGSITKSISFKRDKEHPTEGYMIIGEKAPIKKVNCHIMVPKEDGKLMTDSDIAILDLVLECYKSDDEDEKDYYRNYRNAWKEFKKGEGNEYFPVYYSKANELLYLAPAVFTKEAMHTRIGELIPHLKPCSEIADACPACALFGMTGTNNEDAIASRVRILDAYPTKEMDASEYYADPVTLQILGGPKINNTDFYLQRPEGALYWNYDYYVKGGKAVIVYKDESKAILRGRKFYWHQMEMGKDLPVGIECSNQNQTIRPVKAGITFTGKVYFENISQKQLLQLLWIFNCGSEDDRKGKGAIAYKIGHGKPLGLGSVELQVETVTERSIEIKEGTVVYREEKFMSQDDVQKITYKEDDEAVDPDSTKHAIFAKGVKKDFILMSSLNSVPGELVSYPITEQQQKQKDLGETVTEGFKWFEQNHQNVNQKWVTKRCDMRINEILPSISEEVYMKREATKNGQNAESTQTGNSPIEGQEYPAVVKKIEGRKITFNIKVFNIYIALKAGEPGLEDVSKSEISTLFSVGSEVSLIFEGANDKKGIWRYMKPE